MKRFLPVILLVCIFSNAFSQLDERLFFQLGGTVGADFTKTTGKIRTFDISNNQINYASVILTGRINFLEFSNNASMSIGAHPTISLGRAYNEVGGGSNLSFRLPAFLELNFGAGATVSTRKDFGFGIGLGAQYNKYPLLGTVPVGKGTNKEVLGINSQWVSPTIQMGLRFFGDHYYCREVNLRASYTGLNSVDNGTDIAPNEVINKFQSMGVMLSFLQYLNY